ncbi:cytochrome C biogenesis protein [Halobacteriales archaeon QS_8_69_73]|nr:MAG: cytochrome C biogenesis protein [Halobacteriales archaeon QS_8_69_73]
MGFLAEAATSFTLGLATPLSAVCVVPLYPGFLAFLSNQGDDAPPIAVLGVLVALGVVTFMATVGLLFTTVLGTSLTAVVGTVSPPAFGLLALLGAVLLFDLHPQARLPTAEPSQTTRPSLSAFAYGGFFGAIVLPCNPGFISAFFARAFLFSDPVTSMANFLAFGVGMGTPLLAFAVVSEPWRDRVLGVLTDHRRAVNAATGLVLLGISLYYLLVVFEVAGSLV